MSRNVLKIACILCLIALIACGALILGNVFHIGLRYANAEKYAAGAATVEGAVKNLDIHWKDGSVKIAYHDKDTVEISETSPKAIPDKAALRWWLDGDTLRVQYAKSGFFSFWGQKKALTVTLPEGTALTDLGIDVTSGDVTAALPTEPGYRARVTTTSGSFNADVPLSKDGDEYLCGDGSGRVEIQVTSGDVRLTEE